uniref:B1292H11.24 protein n=1 Tax=Oryza sativa subsp. japonica TaxID=39947 RepID=Q6MWA7_ORYSJ|nr:B1292H11.24 [Oryza sativa Japonica Group]
MSRSMSGGVGAGMLRSIGALPGALLAHEICSGKSLPQRLMVMISAPATASDIPVPLCKKGPAEREATINALRLADIIGPLADHQAAASLKEGVTKEASDVAAAATTSGSNLPKKGRKFSSVLRTRRKAPNPALNERDESLRRAARVKATQGGTGRKIEEARASASLANQRADKLARDLVEAREDLLKMRELVAGNERQRQGLERRMSELENNLSEIRGMLQLATAMEAIPSKHAAKTGKETSNGIYTVACHVLACVRLAHPDLDLKRALDQGASDDARKGVMEEVGDLGSPFSPFLKSRIMFPLYPLISMLDVDVEDVQQRGHPDMPVIVPALALESYIPREGVSQSPSKEANMAMTSLDLVDVLANRDRRIQYWKMKLEVAELERDMVKVWFNSYLKSCCTAIAGVCKELRVPRGNPEESAAGYILWLNRACAQLEGIGKRIDEALKQEYCRASRYAGGHVLACIRDHRPHLHLEFLHEGFSRSRRTPAEIDGLAQSMAPLAEKVFRSMDWRWPSW